MRCTFIGTKKLRSNRLFLLLVGSCAISLLYFILFSKTRDPFSEALISSHIFDGCPRYNYKYDDEKILDLLETAPQEDECQRENGLTLLINGEISLNKQYKEYEKYLCKARCGYQDGGYQYRFGESCIVNKDCSRFYCDFIQVNCWRDEKIVHYDLHQQIYQHKRDRRSIFGHQYRVNNENTPSVDPNRYHPNVYVFVLDAAGRNPAKRQMKKTIGYLKKELKAFEFEQYTRVAYSSRENALSAFFGLFGQDVDRETYGGEFIEKNFRCDQPLDHEKYIQFEYEDAGYRTLFNSDYIIDLYMYLDCHGMDHDPATHHSRPFQLLSPLAHEIWNDVPFVKSGYKRIDEKLLKEHLRNSTRCGRNYNHAIKYTQLFMNAYKDIPKMAITWTNEGHASELEFAVSDRYYEKMLRENKKEFENSFLFILSDHGQREGKVLTTPQGYYESNNNLLMVSIPKKFRKTSLESMIRENSRELFTHHDLHATLIDIIRHQPMANFEDRKFLQINGTIGNSWLRGLDPNLKRSCRDLPISSPFCTCNYGKHEPVPKEDELWIDLPKLIENDFNDFLIENQISDLCEEIQVNNISLLTQIQVTNSYHVEFYSKREAFFSADYKRIDERDLKLTPREFMRINRYGITANCITHSALLKPLCYCRKQDQK